MSQTKAAKIIKRLLDNDLASSLLLAISNNDERAFEVALKKAKLTVDDLTLSTGEYDDLVKGIKPSGELDLLTWEGYYVVNTNTPQSDPLALMILAGTGKVYWGTQSRVLGNPDRHVVDHRITSDNKLEFSTRDDGLVSISLQRKYDAESATAVVTFSGVCAGKDISGVKIQLPVDFLNLEDHTQQETSMPKRAIVEMAGDSWHEHEAVANLMTIFTLLSTLAMTFQVYLWIRDKAWRKEGSERVRNTLEEEAPFVEKIARRGTKDPKIKLDGAGQAVDAAIASKINQDLQKNPPDWERNPDDITREREGLARTATEEALQRYVEDRALPEFRKSFQRFRAFPNYDRMLGEIGGVFVKSTVDGLMDRFGTSFGSAVHPLVLEQRKQHFARNYRSSDESLRVKDRELQEVQDRKTKLQKQVDESNEKIAKLKGEEKAEEARKEEQRRDQLEDEKRRAVEEERTKQQERVEKSREKEAAKTKKDGAEKDSRNDDSKTRWEETKKRVFGK